MVKVEHGVSTWAISPTKGIKESVVNHKKYLRGAKNVFAWDYIPELDMSPVLEMEKAS